VNVRAIAKEEIKEIRAKTERLGRLFVLVSSVEILGTPRIELSNESLSVKQVPKSFLGESESFICLYPPPKVVESFR
jgi:hypothetical protein